MEWISSHKVQDLKHLLGDHTMMEEGIAILRDRKKFTFHQGALYHHHTLPGELEEALQFVLPMAHGVVAMNGCHRDGRHQGLQWMLSLLQDQFWWPGMAMWMQKVISSCERCIQHKCTRVKALLQAILVTSPLELLHVDFTSIEMTVELDQPPHVLNDLVFCDHCMRHVMAYVIPDQAAKAVARFLWQGYILIFRAPAKLLSDWGANFESNIFSGLCELMGIQKVWTLPYHSKLMGRRSKPTKCCCGWLGNWVKIRRQTGQSIYQNWCLLTTPWYWLSLSTAHTTWCLGNNCTYPLTFIFPLL